MELDLNEIAAKIKQENGSNRAALLTSWNQQRFQHLLRFRSKAALLKPAVIVEQVAWEDNLSSSKNYEILRNEKPLMESTTGCTAYPARKHFTSEQLFCNVYLPKFAKEHHIANLKQHIANLTLLKHPHLVQLDKAFETTNRPKIYLFMIYPKHGNAKDYLLAQGSHKPIPLNLCKKWMRNIFSALAYLHSLGLAHNAVIINHILLGNSIEDAVLSVPDEYVECFGDSVDNPVTIPASHRTAGIYLPEKMSGCGGGGGSGGGSDAHASSKGKKQGFNPAAADVWQAGALLYELLVRKAPFERAKPEQFREDLLEATWKNIGLYDSSQPKLDEASKDFLSLVFLPEADRWTSIELIGHAYLKD